MSEHEVLIVVYRPGPEFLVLRRSPWKGGYWMPPAGRVEPGEDAATAAARELEEETGLRAELTPLDLDLGYEKPEGWVRVDAFSAPAPAAWEPVLNEEHVSHRWCSAEEADRVIAYPEPREAVRALAGGLEAAP